MGAAASVGLKKEDILDLCSRTKFTEKQIKHLRSRFSVLDAANAGFISTRDFKFLPELLNNPLADRILEVVKSKRSRLQSVEAKSRRSLIPVDGVDFELFVYAMDSFHPDKVTEASFISNTFLLA